MSSTVLKAGLGFSAEVPWLYAVNHSVLAWLARVLPHNYFRDSVAEFLVLNPLLSTWIFGAAYFAFWRIQDEHTESRRAGLFAAVLALVTAVTISFAVRPWISWPAPARASGFRSLYPAYFWAVGSSNSFPSHSTLLYFTVALGFWPMYRRLSILLMVLVLVAVSWPRMYMGGHYPIDVVGSLILALACYVGARFLLRSHTAVQRWLTQSAPAASVRDLALFLWVFELANGFQATNSAIVTLLRVSRHMLHG